MKRIFILIGGANSGKTTILKNYSPISRDIIKNGVLTRIRRCSPQELVKIFCKYEGVKNKVDDLIKRTENKIRKIGIQHFNLIIAFTLQVKKEILGKNCIIFPLKHLRNKYEVYTIHLSRVGIKFGKEIDNFIRENTNPSLTLISNEEDNKKNNVEKLKKFVANYIKQLNKH